MNAIVIEGWDSPVHPAANWFPLIEGEEFARLVDSVRTQGLDEPIWLNAQGVLLDGRNRLRACTMAGVKPTFQQYNGDDEVAFIIRRNLDRRHLDESQRALIAARRHTAPQGRPSRKTDKFISFSQVAEELNVSVPSVRHGKKVLEHGDQVVIEAVDQGRLAVSTAATIANLPADEQRRLIDAADRKAIIAEANRIKAEQRSQRKATKQQQMDAAIERSRSVNLEGIDLRTGDFREVMADISDLDAIVTDPPYPREYLPLLDDLATWAQSALKPTGVLAVMIGQSYLPEVFQRLGKGLPYLWTLAYLTPGGQAVQVWDRKVNTFWKPILVYGTTSEWFADVARSAVNDNDKQHHEWGQSVSGMTDLLQRLVSPGAHVADPFLGAGTTAISAIRHGCTFTGCDIEPRNVAITRARLSEEAFK